MQIGIDNSFDQGSSYRGLSELLLSKASVRRGTSWSACDVQQRNRVESRFSQTGQRPSEAGPGIVSTTPGSPVTLAQPPAMKAALSSFVATTVRSPLWRIASNSSTVWVPGKPKTQRTPPDWSASTIRDAPVCALTQSCASGFPEQVKWSLYKCSNPSPRKPSTY